MPKSKPYLNGKNAAPQAGDEAVGDYSRRALARDGSAIP
jgi:hypothetical protein